MASGHPPYIHKGNIFMIFRELHLIPDGKTLSDKISSMRRILAITRALRTILEAHSKQWPFKFSIIYGIRFLFSIVKARVVTRVFNFVSLSLMV